jgi:HK97 family phage major capsid protein
MMVGGIATAAAARTFPFRVFSFPKEIEIPRFDGGYLVPKAFSDQIKLSVELLEDSRFDLEKFLAQEWACRFSQHMFTGAGTIEPLGILRAFPTEQVRVAAAKELLTRGMRTDND